jgi:hypothetical protein
MHPRLSPYVAAYILLQIEKPEAGQIPDAADQLRKPTTTLGSPTRFRNILARD